MKIKGKVVDYALLIAVGVGLFWCLYNSLISSDASVPFIVLVFSLVIYIVYLPKRNRQIQSSEQAPKEDEPRMKSGRWMKKRSDAGKPRRGG